jgi:glycosyltransferase involved in cell wall biosynthesis
MANPKNVADIMGESDIYIITSRTEGRPILLLEAIFHGLVCISYDYENRLFCYN